MADDCCSDVTSATTKPSCLASFFKYAKSKCYSVVDVGLNLYCAIIDIASAIREYTDKVQEKGYASGVIMFSTIAGEEVDPNDVIVTQHAKSPFNYKVLGIGVSTMDWNDCGGAYVGDASIEVRFWDFTAGKQIGQTLLLSPSSLHDKDTDEGETISDNIVPGHIYGAKVTYLNTESASCTMPQLDFSIIVSPIDVITED